MPKDKNLKELKKLRDLTFGAPIVLQGPEILKARSDTVKLSKLAGITLHTITKIESGATTDPRIETVKKVTDALGVSIDDLIK